MEREEAVMRGTRVASFELLQYAGGGCNGAVFLARCREGVGNPFWKCVEGAAIADLPPASRHHPPQPLPLLRSSCCVLRTVERVFALPRAPASASCVAAARAVCVWAHMCNRAAYLYALALCRVLSYAMRLSTLHRAVSRRVPCVVCQCPKRRRCRTRVIVLGPR